MTEAERLALQQRLESMTDSEVARAYNACAVESEEADVIAEVMRERDIDD